MSISPDQLQVASFDTTPAEPYTGTEPLTPVPLCDSPRCVPTFDPPCPEPTIAEA